MKNDVMKNKMSRAFYLLAVLASFSLVLRVPVAQAQDGRPVLITQSVDETKLITLAGNMRPEASARFDRGQVADDLPIEHMLLQLKRSAAQEQELQEFINSVQDKSSPNFHHWILAKEFGERFGLAQQDLDTITHWLQSHGLTVNVVYQNGLLIDFSGTAGQVREALRTEIHNLDVKGVNHIANMSNPKIPAALAPAVAGVVSMHDFKPRAMYERKADYTFTSNGTTVYAVVPADLATIYNMNPLFKAGLSGQGQTIALVEDADIYNNSDWTTFRSVFGLSSYTGATLTTIHPSPVSGANNCLNPGTNPDSGEASLDVEYASAAAPSAALELASCYTGTTFGGLIAVQNLLNASTAPPSVISMSYGECEAWNGAASNAAYNSAYEQAATEGVSMFVSSGDQGASVCRDEYYYSDNGIGVNAYASTPYNVAVGGTDYSDTYFGTNTTYWSSTNTSTYESALSYVPEVPWNDSCADGLLGQYYGDSIPYGENGFCNNGVGEAWLEPVAGSGGPSGCATGTPAQPGVVGGTCAGWPKPTWQSLVGVPNDGVRDLPDVSLFASNGVWGHYFPFCWSDPNFGSFGSAPCTSTPDTWSGAGGTSFASPIMAGIQALVNQKTEDRQGNPNPVYYTLAANEYGTSGSSSCNSTLGNAAGKSCIFYDVTLGDNDVDCLGPLSACIGYDPSGGNTIYGALSLSPTTYEPAYPATTGWDFTTGIGSVNAANLVKNWPAPIPDFSLAAAPSSVTVVQGQSVTSAIAIVPQGGFKGSVKLSVANLPKGVTASFSPNPASTNSTLTLKAGATATPGPVTLTITGTSGTITNTATLSLTVTQKDQHFTLSAAPSAVMVVQGVGSGTSTINITPVNGFSGNVTLAVSGLPKGVTASLSENPAITSSVLTLTASATAQQGTATVTITGTSGTLSASTTISLTVNPLGNFSLQASPSTLTVERGSSGMSTITIVPKDGFDQNVTLIVSGLPAGVTESLVSNGNSTSTLTLTVANSAALQKSPITITGIYGTISHDTFVTLTVTK